MAFPCDRFTIRQLMKGQTMTTKKFTIIALISTVVVVFLSVIAITTAGQAFPVFQSNTETEKIQKVIEESYKIEAKAGRDFDTSKFSSVFINDQRGGQLEQPFIDLITSVALENEASNYGYLDYKLAYYTWWGKGSLQYEAIESKAKSENRKMTKEELKSLFDEKGRLAMPRLKGEEKKPILSFTTIEVNDDMAIAVFDDGPRTNQMTLVKVEGQWFIAGNKITAVHP